MPLNSAFQPLGPQIHRFIGSTPAEPFQVLKQDGSSTPQIRIVVVNATGNTEVHLAYAGTAKDAKSIADSGGDTSTSHYNTGIITLPGPTSERVYSIPPGSWLLPWCALAGKEADIYLCPGEGQ